MCFYIVRILPQYVFLILRIESRLSRVQQLMIGCCVGVFVFFVSDSSRCAILHRCFFVSGLPGGVGLILLCVPKLRVLWLCALVVVQPWSIGGVKLQCRHEQQHWPNQCKSINLRQKLEFSSSLMKSLANMRFLVQANNIFFVSLGVMMV